MKGTPAPLATDWISHLAQVVLETEKELPKKHILTQQYMNGIDFIADERVAMITTQYICQSSNQVGGVEALDKVYPLNKPIELNETAFYPIWY